MKTIAASLILWALPFALLAEKDSKTVTLTEKNFEETVLKSDKPVLVDFWATWCGPCLALAPAVEEIATDFEGKVVVGKLDVDDNQALAQKYAIRAIPNLKIFKDGKVVGEIVGLVKKEEIAEKLKEHL